MCGGLSGAPQTQWLERVPALLPPRTSRRQSAAQAPWGAGVEAAAGGSWVQALSPRLRSASGSEGPLQPGETAAKGVRSSSSPGRRSAAGGPAGSLAHPSLLRAPLPSSSPQPGLTAGVCGTTHADRTPAATYCSAVPSPLCSAVPFP